MTRRPLTPRQLQVLELKSRGLGYGEIAAALGISSGTVKRHMEMIYLKLGASSPEEAYRAMGWMGAK